MRYARPLLVILGFLIFFFPPPTKAQVPGLSMELQAGFDGFYKANTWLPVLVTVTNEVADLQARLEVESTQQYSGPQVQYIQPVDLPGQSRKQFALSVPLNGEQSLTVKLVDQEGNLLSSREQSVASLAPDDLLVGVVATDPSLLNALAGLTTASGNRVAVAHLELEDLPAMLQAWTSLDVLVFNDVDTSHLTPAQHELLNSWIGNGGRLVVGGGPNALQTIAGLGGLLPFSEVELKTLAHPLTAFQRFAGRSIPDRGPYVAAVPLQSPAGRVLVQEAEAPLVLLAEQGLGQVYYLAFDLGLAPLDGLVAQGGFFPKLLQHFGAQYVYESNYINYHEMRTSLTYIPNQPLPSPTTVACFLFFYILIVGPANYLFLRRFKRRDWAWVTIPVIVFLFSGLGYWSGFRLRGSQPLVRQITLIRANLPQNTPLAEVSSFIGIFSPFRTAYALELDQPALVASIPDYYGGAQDLAVTGAGPVRVENLATDVGGMATIVARSQMPAPQITADLDYNRQNGQIQGAINNNTGQPIHEAYLVVGSEVLRLGTLPVGENPVKGRLSPLGYGNFYPQPANSQTAEETIALASRDTAVRAVLNVNYYRPTPLPTMPLYLVGWQEGSPVTVDLPEYNFDRQDETLLMLTLPFN